SLHWHRRTTSESGPAGPEVGASESGQFRTLIAALTERRGASHLRSLCPSGDGRLAVVTLAVSLDHLPDCRGHGKRVYPATNLTSCAWRVVEVFSNKCLTWVLAVLSEIPRTSATSGTPPTSMMANRTRSSVGVRLNCVTIASGGEGKSSAALWTKTVATAL